VEELTYICGLKTLDSTRGTARRWGGGGGGGGNSPSPLLELAYIQIIHEDTRCLPVLNFKLLIWVSIDTVSDHVTRIQILGDKLIVLGIRNL
jgi:hypothetical protein